MNMYFLSERLERDRKETKNFFWLNHFKYQEDLNTHTNFTMYSNAGEHHTLEGLLKQIAGPSPRSSDSGNLGRGMKICISNMFPADASGSHTKPARICSRNHILRITRLQTCFGKP